jgi:hypothetical protein
MESLYDSRAIFQYLGEGICNDGPVGNPPDQDIYSLAKLRNGMSAPLPDDDQETLDAGELDRRAEAVLKGEECLSWEEHIERVESDE